MARGCSTCGNAHGKGVAAAEKKLLSHLGSMLLVKVEYLGTESLEPFYGVVSGATYVFGTTRLVGLVDVWDMPALINSGKLEKMVMTETATKKKQTPKPKVIEVQVLKTEGKSALVQWIKNGAVDRRYVPVGEITDGLVPEGVLAECPQYGLPWELVAMSKVTPDDLARALRNSGIWTLQDLAKNPNKIIGILQAAYSVDLAALLTFAQAVNKEK